MLRIRFINMRRRHHTFQFSPFTFHFIELEVHFCGVPLILYKHLYNLPGGYHVADIAEDDKYVEYRVNIGYLLKAIQYSSYDVGYALANDPQHNL